MRHLPLFPLEPTTTNRFGLRESDMVAITQVLRDNPVVEQAVLFGSRAKGNYRNGSDVDIAIKGANITYRDVIHIQYVLNEETLMPYRFDVLHYEQVAHEPIGAHIQRVGAILYDSSVENQASFWQ